jgi:hypothetical protein
VKTHGHTNPVTDRSMRPRPKRTGGPSNESPRPKLASTTTKNLLEGGLAAVWKGLFRSGSD